MSPGGALAVSVMPQVGPRWGRPVGREARGVNDPPPCLLYRIHYTTGNQPGPTLGSKA